MIEKEMGYRGSKSYNILCVKEQRVNGNWFLVRNTRNLRCTLMGFKRNYQFNFLSVPYFSDINTRKRGKQLNQQKFKFSRLLKKKY